MSHKHKNESKALDTSVESEVPEVETELDQDGQAEAETPVAEDRSVFNCEACKGLGLLDSRHVCEVCGGTGKV